ncbi:MAG: DUF692 domain-containing protein [Crocinitomicaceae bacterium]|nr:DUF692 domain-containing protein [Crocinitomicaceae bacterium]
MKQIPVLGSGIGYRNEIKDELIFDHSEVDFVEVIGEHFMGKSAYMQQELMELMAEYTVIPHFIGCSLGSAEGVDLKYLESVAKLLEKIKPPYWSEHIAFTNCHGIEIGHLTPSPYTQEALDVFSKNLEETQRIIETPLILENITYILNDPIQQMTEAAFLKNLFEANPDIGMLLDITNLYINSTNHNYDYKEWLSTIETNNVVQIHYVGHDLRDDFLIDNHSYPTQEPIWELMTYIKAKCPNLKGSILERDNKFGSMLDLRSETKRAKNILFN